MILRELASFKRIDDEQSGEPRNADIKDGQGRPSGGPGNIGSGTMDGGEMNDFDPNADETSEDEDEIEGIANDATQDPDRQGLIRNVKGAKLIYKRRKEDETFEELWMYNIGNIKDEVDIRKAILAGTDISVAKQAQASDDKKQEYSTWSVGNVEMLHITGLVQ